MGLCIEGCTVGNIETITKKMFVDVSKKGFSTLMAYTNLFIGHV
jgi:hypothetical protein